jgi:hypothetical protein
MAAGELNWSGGPVVCDEEGKMGQPRIILPYKGSPE